MQAANLLHRNAGEGDRRATGAVVEGAQPPAYQC